jgi:hypothetical protein
MWWFGLGGGSFGCGYAFAQDDDSVVRLFVGEGLFDGLGYFVDGCFFA